MRITSLSISHFRGINSGKLWFPLDQRLICIIGSGDSCKSTVLKAIEWAMWPTWNLIATDTDFYKSNTSEPIVIEASIAEIPDNFLSDDKFGLYLRDAEAVYKGEDNDEPVDDKTFVITIRLTIDDSLEPKWEVISNRLEPKYISPKERQALSCGVVGYDYEKDFVWGRNSILKKYTDSKDTLHSAYTRAMREAVSKANLKELDATSETLRSIGRQYGVSFSGDVSNKILMQNGSFSTMAGLFDGEVPFVLRGLGSRRLLSMGMNINLYDGNSMLLIDEIETGLEPYRICGLINEFRKAHQSKGQIIMTTHSQNVVTECNVGELMVIDSRNGEVKLHSLKAEDTGVNDSISSLIRTDPSAFLCKRLIVCEGKTEVGFIRAIDKKYALSMGTRFSYYGATAAYGGGGDKFFKLANLLKKCGYDVCILKDSDCADNKEQYSKAKGNRIPIFEWEAGNAIEEQLFSDVSISCINKLIELVIETKSFDHVKNKLKDCLSPTSVSFVDDAESVIITEHISHEERKTLGKVAKHKNSEWFKRIGLGEQVGDIIFSHYNDVSKDSRLVHIIEGIQDWVSAQ